MKKFLIAALMLVGAQAFGLDAVTDADFEAKVLKSKGFVVVVAEREGCPPCQLYLPNMEGAAKKLGDKAKFYQFDITKNEEMDGYLGIQATPTTFVFRDGKPLSLWMGALPLETDVVTAISNSISNADKLSDNLKKLEDLSVQMNALRKSNHDLILPDDK